MKITKVEIFDCEVNRRDATVKGFNPIILRLHTDEGITGLGKQVLPTEQAPKLLSACFATWPRSASVTIP